MCYFCDINLYTVTSFNESDVIDCGEHSLLFERLNSNITILIQLLLQRYGRSQIFCPVPLFKENMGCGGVALYIKTGVKCLSIMKYVPKETAQVEQLWVQIKFNKCSFRVEVMLKLAKADLIKICHWQWQLSMRCMLCFYKVGFS